MQAIDNNITKIETLSNIQSITVKQIILNLFNNLKNKTDHFLYPNHFDFINKWKN